MSDKRTKTNSGRIHWLDEQDRSSPVAWHAPAADETPAAFISTIGNDALAEMRSTASLDQKLAYFRQMLSQDFDLDGISRFVLGPYWRTASPEQQAHVALLGWDSAAEMIHFHCVPLATRRLSFSRA